MSLNYGSDEPAENPERLSASSSSSDSSASSAMVVQEQEAGCRIDLDWSAGDDEDQVALRLQSQLMVAQPVPRDAVVVELRSDDGEEGNVSVEMKVVKRKEPLRAVSLNKTAGTGVLKRLLRLDLASQVPGDSAAATACGEHWKSVTVLSLANCGLLVSLWLALDYEF